MKNNLFFLALVVGMVMMANSAIAGVPVMVTITGEVEFNQISPPPLGSVNPGETATMTFMLDSDEYVDDPFFPTRGYVIDQWSFSQTFDSADMELQDPFPAGVTPYFVIRDNDPAVDGFFVATSTAYPFGFGLPLNQTGIFGQFQDSFRVTYEGDTLPSLDILDALGTYDYSGLTVFGWSLDDGPFEAMFIIFNDMTIEISPMDEDEDGIMDWDDMCPGTVVPESVPTIRLGVNHWALTDEDGSFDTTHPNGNGPGFIFDLEDTAGCSCEQIIEMLELGEGHIKFGCSNSAMMEWIAIVAGTDYGMDGGVVGSPEAPQSSVSTDGVQHFQLSGSQKRESRAVRSDGARRGGDRLAGGN